MCRCICAMIMVLAVCFTEPGNTQKTLANNTTLESVSVSLLAGVPSVLPTANLTTPIQPPPQASSVLGDNAKSSIEAIRLTTTCLRDTQCVFKTSGISYKVLESALPIIPGITCSREECVSDSQTCSCCDESEDYLQGILKKYSEAKDKYQKLVTDGAPATETQKANNESYHLQLKLQQVCSKVYCSDATRQTCEFLQCKPQTCDATTTTITSTTSTTKTTATTTASITTKNPATTNTLTPLATKTKNTSKATTIKTTSSSSVDDNGQNQMIYTTPTSAASNMQTTGALGAEHDSHNVAALILGVVLSLLVSVGVAVFLIFWWRRRRAEKGGKAHGSPSTIGFVTESDTGESQYSELSHSVGCRQTADEKTSGAQPNRDSEYEHEYSVIPADVVKFTHPNDLDPGYDVLIDVTKRKLPPAPAQDGEYSLAQNPDGEMKKKPPVPSGLKPVVHSLAKTTAIQELKGQNNAERERKEKQRQYFVLEKDEDDFDNGEKKDGQYFILEENADGDKHPETKPKIGGQYFVLEKENADEKPETGGQYFVLEKDTANGNDKRENGGQYFVLEKEDADENPETGGQYFVLEKDSSDASGQDQTGDNKVYSSLNRDDMEPVDAAEQASEYTALDNSRAGTTSPGSQTSVVPQQESVYSLQKPID